VYGPDLMTKRPPLTSLGNQSNVAIPSRSVVALRMTLRPTLALSILPFFRRIQGEKTTPGTGWLLESGPIPKSGDEERAVG